MVIPEHVPQDANFRLALPPDPRNTFLGAHCTDFTNYMAATGVYDTIGKNHRGWAGATEFFPEIRRFRLAPASNSQNVWECPCAPGIYFDSQTACDSVAPCKSGLGGCLQKCGGFLGVCLTAKVKLPIAGSIKVSLLQWRPPSPTAVCQAAISDFDASVLKHENHHEAAAAKILADAKAAPERTFKACGKTLRDADVKLKQIANQAARDQVDAMIKAFDDSVKTFHNSAGGQPTFINCGAC